MRTLDEIFKDLAEGTETLKHCQEVIFITTNFPLQSRSHECQWQLKLFSEVYKLYPIKRTLTSIH